VLLQYVERRVDGVVSEVKEPRGLRMPIDEGDCFVGEQVGEIAVERLDLPATVDQVLGAGGAENWLGILAQDVVMPADEEAEVVVEAAGLRMVSGIETLMPFADEAGRIASGAEAISDRSLVERQAECVFIAHVRIELMAEAGLIAAGEKA